MVAAVAWRFTVNRRHVMSTTLVLTGRRGAPTDSYLVLTLRDGDSAAEGCRRLRRMWTDRK
jgi:hypothetical protein